MNDPMSAYEQCPYCGEYTDGSCCLVKGVAPATKGVAEKGLSYEN